MKLRKIITALVLTGAMLSVTACARSSARIEKT